MVFLALVIAGGVFVDRSFFTGLGVGAVLPCAALALFLWRVSKSVRGQGGEVELPPPPIPTGAFDYAWSVRALDGKEFALADTRGKVLFLNLWATWCGPCTAEMPAIQRLADAVRDDGVVFLCISDEKPEVVRLFVEKEKLALPVYLRAGDVPAMFKTRGIPATFILKRNGEVAFQHVGSARWDDPVCVGFVKSLTR